MNPKERYKKSKELMEKTLQHIPLGSQTFSKSYIQFPELAPHFIVRGKGSRVWDADGNEYIDFVNGLLPVILGYCDPDVDRAVTEQLSKGVSFSLASPLEGELAEILTEIIPCAEMVRFGKNGSDATTGAVRVARAYTGRDRVAVCGYHGWQDWYIGSTARSKGVPEAVRQLTHPFKYNDLASLQGLFDKYPEQFAAVIMEPMSAEEPTPGFLEGVKDLTHKNGAVLIFDEIITGFRFALGGAQELFAVTPDLAAIGKSMANGFPVSAVVGQRALMKEMEEVFFSFTFGGETISLAAALATVKKMMREPVIQTLWKEGKKIKDGVSEAISRHGLGGVFSVVGKPPWSLLMTGDHATATSWEIKSVFKQEMLLRGVLISASHNMSYAHSQKEVDLLLAAYEDVFALLRGALEKGTLREALVGNPIEPIFKIR